MDIERFVREREGRWKRLEALLETVQAKGVGKLPAVEAEEFFTLYRLVSSDLNLLQTRMGNPGLLEFLEGLVGRAWAHVAEPRSVHPFKAWWRIIRHGFPATMRRELPALTLSAGLMMAGALFGFVLTLASPETSEVFLMPFPEHQGTSPRARVAKLEAAERDGNRSHGVSHSAAFGSFLFTHNIRVTVLVFALGLTYGIGTVSVLFFNGTILGSIAALYLEDGVFTFFVAWVGPHGSIELPCIMFGGTAGLMLARGLYTRDKGTLGQQFTRMRPDLVNIIVGSATLLVFAGIIEGSFSQVNEPTLPYILKIAVALALFLGLIGYLFLLPVRDPVRSALENQVAGMPSHLNPSPTTSAAS